ncbi:MAG: PAS domain S-box protein [Cyanobacteria bacterium]|nr:PAS domain S-box protein [Cyanobacteriota bacterium]
MSDISSQNLAAALIRDKRTELIIDMAFNSFVSIDAEGRIVDWNRRAEQVFGWTREEVQGKTLPETIIPERFQDAHVQGLARYLLTGEAHVINKRVEVSARKKSGEEIPVELGVFPVTLDDGMMFCAFLEDISERKDAEAQLVKTTEELMRSNRDLEFFAYVAAHDLREPLRTIVSFSKLLEMDLDKDLSEDSRENLTFMVDAAKRMQNLIDALLSYSRVQTRAGAMVEAPLDKILEKVIVNLKTGLQEVSAQVSHTELPTVTGDPSQLAQLLQNLLANSIRFHAEEPLKISISATLQNSLWEIAVSDNGIGLDMEYKERIFQMFQRLHSQGEYPGTGMGLAICKKIVERHGGTITVESELGRGATFKFTLPADSQGASEE